MGVFFSIIIPTYNSAETICSCINSILSQNFKFFEILILDGLSTDRTVDLLYSFSDERIKIYSEKDSGTYDAMNKGLNLANGEWLYFLGSDDQLYDTNVLSDVYDRINCDNEISVLYGNVKIDGELPFWANGSNIYGGEFSFERLKKQNICHQAIFYRKALILKKKIRYNLNFPVCADWELNIKCWIQSPFYYFDRTICLFAAGGISSLNTDNFGSKIEFTVLKYENKFVLFCFRYVLQYFSSIKSNIIKSLEKSV